MLKLIVGQKMTKTKSAEPTVRHQNKPKYQA